MEASNDVVMYWLQAERSNARDASFVTEVKLPLWRRSAALAGMHLELIAPDDVVVSGSRDGIKVWVAGTPVDPTSCLFHTSLMPAPGAERDTWRLLSLAGVLEASGFHTTVPAAANLTTNDKLLTVMRYGVDGIDWLPTTRISTRGLCGLPAGTADLSYPVVVKPANWGGGHGILRAESPDELRSILQLAGAGELTMVVQPWLGYGVVDFRVYCFDGVAYRANARTPIGTALVGNVCQGGKIEIVDIPDALRGPAEAVAKLLGLSYTCVDFLQYEGRYWLSEVEVDGGAPDEDMTNRRFAAYRVAFDRFRTGANTTAKARP
jgi:hypothetical protein